MVHLIRVVRSSFVEVLPKVAQDWLQNGFKLASKWQASKSGFKIEPTAKERWSALRAHHLEFVVCYILKPV